MSLHLSHCRETRPSFESGIPFLSFFCVHLCIKCSLSVPNFLEELSSLSHSIVFLYFFALITEEVFLSLLAILWSSAFKQVYLTFSPLPFASFLFSAICKASSDNLFAFLFLGDGLDHCFLYNVANLCPWFFGHFLSHI